MWYDCWTVPERHQAWWCDSTLIQDIDDVYTKNRTLRISCTVATRYAAAEHTYIFLFGWLRTRRGGVPFCLFSPVSPTFCFTPCRIYFALSVQKSRAAYSAYSRPDGNWLSGTLCQHSVHSLSVLNLFMLINTPISDSTTVSAMFTNYI